MFILQPRETEKLELWAGFKGRGICTGVHKHGSSNMRKNVVVAESSEPR
jgi:hypothetical protein